MKTPANWQRKANWIFGTAFLIFASPLVAPQLLAFPYKKESAIGTVWSEKPIDAAALNAVARETQVLLAQSPIAAQGDTRPIFLTNGGWRWQWLANTARGSFALTRSYTDAVVVNESDLTADSVTNQRDLANERTLSGVLAHEFTHGDLRSRFGILHMAMQPTWKVEGYADHVAQESSLSEEEVASLNARGESHPALVYYEGRGRVAERLAANGGSVEALFESRD